MPKSRDLKRKKMRNNETSFGTAHFAALFILTEAYAADAGRGGDISMWDSSKSATVSHIQIAISLISTLVESWKIS